MYNYQEQKRVICTSEKTHMIIEMGEKIDRMLKTSGAFTMGSAIAGICGGSWEIMACVDYFVEYGKIREISQPGCAGQHRVFVSKD